MNFFGLGPGRLIFIFVIVLGLAMSYGSFTTALIITLAFLPSIAYLYWLRNLEKTDKEPWELLGQAFTWGALSSIFLALFISSALITIAHGIFGDGTFFDVEIELFVGAVIVAPFVEEAVKPWGILRNQNMRKEVDELEDGSIYGAACGLGFASTENLFYGLGPGYLLGGTEGAVILVIARSLSSTLLHASATSFTGHGIARYVVEKEPFSIVVRHYAAAVAVHAVFNASVLINPIYGFLVALIVAISGIEFTRRRIIDLDLRAVEVAYQEQLLQQPSRDDWWKHSGDKWRERTNSWENKKYRV
tara:strand:- start:165 stop:1076 length:912 start_codon:yes stop_codon:yes gene_type:complete